MFVRFVLPHFADARGRRASLVYAAKRMMAEDILDPAEAGAVRAILRWLDRNLAKTGRLVPARDVRRLPGRIVWIKASARAHVARFEQLAAILRAHGETVDMIRTTKPGRVVHRDAHQIVAESDTSPRSGALGPRSKSHSIRHGCN